MKSRLLADPIDAYAGLREKAKRAAARLEVDLSRIRLDDPCVLKAMTSEKASRAWQTQKLWAPFASPSVRRIMKLVDIKEPSFDDFTQVHQLLNAKAYGSGFLDEYVARRRGADVISIVASTSTEDGRTALRLLNKPKKLKRQVKTPACLKSYLAETFGLLMFDDQLVAIGAGVSGLSPRSSLSLCHDISNEGNQRRIARKFVIGGRARRIGVAELDEALWYLGYARYAQPTKRESARAYVRQAYEHSYLWLKGDCKWPCQASSQGSSSLSGPRPANHSQISRGHLNEPRGRS